MGNAIMMNSSEEIELPLVRDIYFDEDARNVYIDTDNDGNPLSLKRLLCVFYLEGTNANNTEVPLFVWVNSRTDRTKRIINSGGYSGVFYKKAGNNRSGFLRIDRMLDNYPFGMWTADGHDGLLFGGQSTSYGLYTQKMEIYSTDGLIHSLYFTYDPIADDNAGYFGSGSYIKLYGI